MVSFTTQTRASDKINMPAETRSGRTTQPRSSSVLSRNKPGNPSNTQRKTCCTGVHIFSNLQLQILSTGTLNSSRMSDNNITSADTGNDPPNVAEERSWDTAGLYSVANRLANMVYIFIVLLYVLMAALSFLILSLSYWLLFK